MTWGLRLGGAGLAAMLAVGCASWPRRLGERPCCFTGKPSVRRESIGWHLFDVTVLEPVAGLLQIDRWSPRLVGRPVRAVNIRDGRLTDSAFLDDRDPALLSPEAVRWGPTRPDDLARPPFRIAKSKMEGRTAGFFVKDADGRRYLFKLDPVDYPELLTGAEAVSSKLLHALGYHVPSNEVVQVDPQTLSLDPAAVVKEPSGRTRPMTQADVHRLLEGRLRDGRLRVAASQILEGEIFGPASFRQFKDCAEVRALKVAYAWINYIDTKDHNTLLVWDGARTVGYLIDFGTSLGADAGVGGPGGPQTPCAGRRYVVDFAVMAKEALTLGFYPSPCERNATPFSPAAGLFLPALDPARWKPYAPNVAFSQMTREDARWMAKRLAEFTREQLDAAVAAGQYSRQEDAAYLAETLEARRQAIMRAYLSDATGATR